MNAEARTEKVDIKKLLGNPKITFVLGKYNPPTIFICANESCCHRCPWLWKGNPVRKTCGGVWIYSHFNRRIDARRDAEGKSSRKPSHWAQLSHLGLGKLILKFLFRALAMVTESASLSTKESLFHLNWPFKFWSTHWSPTHHRYVSRILNIITVNF